MRLVWERCGTKAYAVLLGIALEVAQLLYLRLVCGHQQLPYPLKGDAMLLAIGLQFSKITVNAELCFQAARRVVDACINCAHSLSSLYAE